MIPDVSRQALLDALRRFDQECRPRPEWTDWESSRAHRYAIEHEGRRYPVGQVLRLALGSDGEGAASAIRSGQDANAFVGDRGFVVTTLREPDPPVGPAPTLREDIEHILAGYLTARSFEPFGSKHPLWEVFTRLTDALARSTPLRAFPSVEVTWSAGQGHWAKVPWLALLDRRETDTTQQGVYAGLWFRQDMSGAYLTLNQGVTELKKELGSRAARELLKLRAQYLRRISGDLATAGFSLDEHIDLRVEEGLGNDYEVSTVAYKLYPLGHVPSDAALEADLNALLNVYERYVLHGKKELPSAHDGAATSASGSASASSPATGAVRRAFKVDLGDNAHDWDDCLREGYICTGPDEVGDLRMYSDLDSLKAGTRDRFGPLYASASASPGAQDAQRSAEALWSLRSLRAGDWVVAARHAAEVLGVGEVVEPGYSWNPQRAERKHTLRVHWNTRVARSTPLPASWAESASSIAPVKPELLAQILSRPEGEARADLGAVSHELAEAFRAAHLVFGEEHDERVRSFVVSLATKRLVILSGLSGSGKTQLALRFGEWLGAGRALVVPVRPDWTGPEALLGYEDALLLAPDGRRAWHVPEALAFMLRAAADPSHPYLLVLDEMNLAHVERYFADVLSGMESGYPTLPNLQLHSDGRWYVRARAEAKVPVPKNVFLVGTVNVDETTYHFSPKVLDRANTFEFRVHAEDLISELRRPTACAPGTPELVRGFLDVALDETWAARHPPPALELLASRLRTVHRLLADADFEFGHRVFAEALRFAALLAAAGDPAPDHALDLQLMQKLLPRLHGNRRRLDSLLEHLGRFCLDPDSPHEHEHELRANVSIFDSAPEKPPRLPHSFDKLARMRRSLHLNAFTSFTE
jgi:5-methylcytosine-specific restriction protein B